MVTAVPSPPMHPQTPPVLTLNSTWGLVADSGDGGAGGSASNVSGSISGTIVTKGDGSIGLNAQSVGGGGGAAGSVTNSAAASGDASVAGSATLSFGGSGVMAGPQETSPSRFLIHSPFAPEISTLGPALVLNGIFLQSIGGGGGQGGSSSPVNFHHRIQH